MSAAPPLRVATYNMHACVGTDGRHDPDRVAAVDRRTGCRHRGAAGVHLPGERRDRDPTARDADDAGSLRVRAGPDAPDRDRMLRQRAVHAASHRSKCTASICRWSAVSRAAPWPQPSSPAAPSCTCSRRTSACASASAGFRCGRSSTISIRSATRWSSCSVISTTGCRADRWCMCSTIAWDARRARRRSRCTGRSWRSIGSG